MTGGRYILTQTESARQSLCVLRRVPASDLSLRRAGGVFNACLQVTSAIGLAMQTAVFTALGDGSFTDREAYRAAFLVVTGLTAVSVIIVPFLKVRKQGHR
jgi:hypothetical protein